MVCGIRIESDLDGERTAAETWLFQDHCASQRRITVRLNEDLQVCIIVKTCKQQLESSLSAVYVISWGHGLPARNQSLNILELKELSLKLCAGLFF